MLMLAFIFKIYCSMSAGMSNTMGFYDSQGDKVALQYIFSSFTILFEADCQFNQS